jgi:probable HAF family extracellular repeat protein
VTPSSGASLPRSIASQAMRLLARFVAMLATFAITGSAIAQCDYQITVISRPGCSSGGEPTPRAMNDDAVVVGWALPCQSITEKAFRWSESNGFSFLNLGPGLTATRATAIASDGTIAGIAWTGGLGTPHKGFVWKDGAVQFLPTDPNDPGSSVSVEGIFDDGTVVGYMTEGNNLPRRAFAWKDGAYISIGDGFEPLHREFLGASGNGRATGAEEIVGAQDWTAQRWDVSVGGGRGPVVQTPIPVAPPHVRCEGWAVSTQGHVAGRCQKPDPRKGLADSRYRAFYWDGSTTTVVEPLPGHSATFFYDINDLGQAVGLSYCYQAEQCPPLFNNQAIVWQNGTITVLDPLIEDPRGLNGFAIYSVAVNNRGQVLVRGVSSLGGAFLLTPPSTPGDVNADCRVNAHDLTLLFDNWGPVVAGTVLRADLDEDGEVGPFDLGILLGGWTPQ